MIDNESKGVDALKFFISEAPVLLMPGMHIKF